MGFGLEKHTIIGNLGRDPEFKDVAGKKCLEFSVAVTPVQKLEEGQQARTTWYKVTAWEETAKNMNKMEFQKGDKICLDLSNLRAEAWMGKDPEFPNDPNKLVPRAGLKANVANFLDIRESQKETDSQNQQAAMKGNPDDVQEKAKSKSKMAA